MHLDRNISIEIEYSGSDTGMDLANVVMKSASDESHEICCLYIYLCTH